MLISRYLLLLMLPIIALAIYIEGQKYNSSIISFKPQTYNKSTMAKYLPENIEKFSRIGQIRLFTKDNLFEYVNGHAEFFINAGFERLAVGEYVSSDTDQSQPDTIVDIYDMGKDIQAFGVLIDEAGEGPSPVSIGHMGFITTKGISFIKGQYYIKISSFKKNITSMELAKNLDESIKVDTSLNVIEKLPSIGEVITTRFIKQNYRGLEFLNNVIEREYLFNGDNITVSLLAKTKADTDNLISRFMTFFKKDGIRFIGLKHEDSKFYRVLDPFEGDWFLIPAEKSLFGVYGNIKEETIKKLWFFREKVK